MLQRNLTVPLIEALSDSPVVFLQGPRQSGKSTLAQWTLRERPARYLTLDDAGVLSAADRDPAAFLSGLDGPVILDEVQLAPGLFRAIKGEVDRGRKPGRFLLTGSANVLLLPQVSEALAGRMEVLTLWPFSQGELAGLREGVIDALFESKFHVPAKKVQEGRESSLIERVLTGGYPEIALARSSSARRQAWFGSYIATILQRDIRAMADIEGLTQLPRLLSLLATQSSGLLNIAELSRDAGISQPTLKRYLSLLQAAYLFVPLTAWSGNLRKRLIKSPKAYLCDTGLLSYLLGIDDADSLRASVHAGAILESFVAQELRKEIGWSRLRPALHYFRTAAGKEVDFLLEDRKGRVVGIEVKASATLRSDDLRGLEELAAGLGHRFHRGVVLYQGEETVPFAANLHGLPIDTLWRVGRPATGP